MIKTIIKISNAFYFNKANQLDQTRCFLFWVDDLQTVNCQN